MMTKLKTTLIAALLGLGIFAGMAVQGAPAMADEQRVPLNQIVNNIHADRGGEFMGARYNNEMDRYRIVWRKRNGDVITFVANPNNGRYRRASDEGNYRGERR